MKFLIDQTPPTQEKINNRKKHLKIRHLLLIGFCVCTAAIIIYLDTQKTVTIFYILDEYWVWFFVGIFISIGILIYFAIGIFESSSLLTITTRDKAEEIIQWCKEDSTIAKYQNAVVDLDRSLVNAEHFIFEIWMENKKLKEIQEKLKTKEKIILETLQTKIKLQEP